MYLCKYLLSGEFIYQQNKGQQKQFKYSSDEDFYIGKKIPAETYDRLRSKLVEEKRKILESLSTFSVESSNLKEYYANAMQLSSKLATVWTSNGTPVREKLQKMIFPDGVGYNHKNGTFLTENVNEMFAPIAGLYCVSGGDTLPSK